MVVTPVENQFVTARAHPKLVLITPSINGNKITLTAPDAPKIELDFNKLREKQTNISFVWQQKVNTIDCGEEIAKWLSLFILGEDTGLRLQFYPDSYPTRPNREYNNKFKITNSDVVRSLINTTQNKPRTYPINRMTSF